MSTDPAELLVRNLFLLQRAGTSVNDGVRERVRALFDEIAALVARVDPTGPALQRYRLQRAEKLFDEIAALTGATFDEITREVRVHLAGLGRQQADAATLHLRATLGAGAVGKVEVVRATLAQMKAIVDTDPIQGALLKDWFAKQSADTVFRVRREIQLGMANAEGIDQMVRRVRGRAAGFEGPKGARVRRYAGGAMQTTTREAEAIVRTAVSHISTAATERTFRANANLISGVQWVSTLDGRTCEACAALDSKTWRLDDPARPRPPLHIGDRCALIPVPDWAGLGLEPPPSGTRATARDPKTGKPGQVSSDLHYEGWLKSQPKAVQDDILGPARAALFRDGRATLSEMVRTDGRRIPLAELAAAA